MYIISKYLGIYAILHVYLTKTYKSSYLIAISNCYLHKEKLIVAIHAITQIATPGLFVLQMLHFNRFAQLMLAHLKTYFKHLRTCNILENNVLRLDKTNH
ncbi:hypothetical protein Hanom_Chr03g00266321 [Helianthus anomalus]